MLLRLSHLPRRRHVLLMHNLSKFLSIVICVIWQLLYKDPTTVLAGVRGSVHFSVCFCSETRHYQEFTDSSGFISLAFAIDL